MMLDNQIFKVLYSPHLSEKSTIFLKKNNVIILKVSIKSNKHEIKSAVQKLFSVNVKQVNTVLVKGKVKKKGKYNIRHNHWKKAYVRLHAGQKINFINNIS